MRLVSHLRSKIKTSDYLVKYIAIIITKSPKLFLEMEDHVQNVKWLDYARNMMDIQRSVYLSSSMFDVIIAAGEIRFKAHQLILRACSDFFLEILSNCPSHVVPTIIIPDLNPKLVEPLLVFMYTGETFIPPQALQEFLDVCNYLQLKGFINNSCLVNGSPMEQNETLRIAKPETLLEHHQLESPIDYEEQTEYVIVDHVQNTVDLCAEEPTSHSGDYEAFEQNNEDNEEYLEEVIDDKNFQIQHNYNESLQPLYTTQPVCTFPCDLNQTAVKAKSKKSTKMKLENAKCSINSSIRNTALENAMRAVTKDGRSLKEASVQYNISKTVLWRKLKQSSQYKPEERTRVSRSDAIAAMERGETLISISKKYNVPLSTLHRDKVRLFEQGKLPEDCKVTRREAGPGYKNRLKNAVACCGKGMSQKVASETYGVPKTTIWRHLQLLNKAMAAEKTKSDSLFKTEDAESGETDLTGELVNSEAEADSNI